MSGMIETEMSDCLEQMAKLQEKMERLQEEKNKQAAEEVVKQNSTEPNLQVMSDWLDKYGDMIEEDEQDRIIIEKYKKFSSGYPIDDEEFVRKKYNIYQNKLRDERSNGNNPRTMKRNEMMRNASFYSSAPSGPSYFMKQYIEATHNMFLIQQKQIDELERKLNNG